jgi:hypothetical protein
MNQRYCIVLYYMIWYCIIIVYYIMLWWRCTDLAAAASISISNWTKHLHFSSHTPPRANSCEALSLAALAFCSLRE